MCEMRRRAAARKIARVVEKTRPCRADSECKRIDTSTECQGTCGAWVNTRYAERVQHFIEHVDERYCDGYQAAGCPYSTPRCVNEQGKCIRGGCTGVPVESDIESTDVR
jgi:hypothetical protein